MCLKTGKHAGNRPGETVVSGTGQEDSCEALW